MPDRRLKRMAAVEAGTFFRCFVGGCFVGGYFVGTGQGVSGTGGQPLNDRPVLYEDTSMGMRYMGAARCRQADRQLLAVSAPMPSPPVVVAVKHRGRVCRGVGPAAIGFWKVLIAALCGSPRRVGEEATLSQDQSRRGVRTMRAARHSVFLARTFVAACGWKAAAGDGQSRPQSVGA